MCELSEPVRMVLLDLPPKGGPHRKAPRDSGSALALREDSLFLGSDEGVVLDRLTRAGDDRFASPRVFPLLDLLDLPNRTGEDDEIDIEGMDIEGDVLWLVGSHSWTRGKPKDDPPRDLEKVKPNPNRHVLACLPLLPDGTAACIDRRRPTPPLASARLPIGKKEGELAKTVKRDVHLGPFGRSRARKTASTLRA